MVIIFLAIHIIVDIGQLFDSAVIACPEIGSGVLRVAVFVPQPPVGANVAFRADLPRFIE